MPSRASLLAPVVKLHDVRQRLVVPPDPEAVSVVPAGSSVDPAPEVAEVPVSDAPVEAGGTGISAAAPDGVPASEVPDGVAVEVLSAQAAEATGASAFAFTVDRTDDGAGEGQVDLEVDDPPFRMSSVVTMRRG